MVVLVVVYVSNSPQWAPIEPRSAESTDPLSSTSASARYLQCPAKEPQAASSMFKSVAFTVTQSVYQFKI